MFGLRFGAAAHDFQRPDARAAHDHVISGSLFGVSLRIVTSVKPACCDVTG